MKIFFLLIDKVRRWLNKKRVIAEVNCDGNIKCYGYVSLLNKNVRLGNNVVLYPGVSFEGDGLIEIGDNVKIGTNTILYSSKFGGIQIDNDTIIAANTYIIDSNHGTSKNCSIASQQLVSEKIIIRSDVWIGANVCVIKGAYIGKGAVIGANSIVNKEIPDFAIVAGVPAKVIKYRS